MTKIAYNKAPLPADLLAAIVISLLTLAFVLIPDLSVIPLRMPLSLAMLLFIPGYVILTALFPRKGELGGIEMAALSLGMSISVVPLIGLQLSRTSLGLRLMPVAVSLSALTIAASAVAYLRRSMLAPEERFSVSFKISLKDLRRSLIPEEAGRAGKAIIAILILGIIISASALLYVIEAPKQGEAYTEFYILGPDGKAYDYMTSIAAGENAIVIAGITSHEYATTNYTLKLNFRNRTVLSKSIVLEDNQTWEQPLQFSPGIPGDNQKLELLLYNNSSFKAPYRELHLWLNVE